MVWYEIFKINKSSSSLMQLTVGNRKHGLNGSEEHHADHHDGEDGDGASSHPHDEHVHGNLFDRAQGNVPGPLEIM